MAAFSTIAMISLAAIGAGSGIYSASKTGKGMELPDMPEPPSQQDAAKVAGEELKRRRTAMSRSESVATSPLGIANESNLVKKKLLGE